MQTEHLGIKFSHTLGRIFAHPVAGNLAWRDVIALIRHLGTVDESGNGNLRFTVNGKSETIHRSGDHRDVSADAQQMRDIRRFLESAGYGRSGAPHKAAHAAAPATGPRVLVVISQQETLVFQSEDKGTVPERLHPYDPHGKLHLLKHADGPDAEARGPENLEYYKEIAAALAGAGEVLLMGSGTGSSSAMTHLQDFLKTHHPEIEGRVAGLLTVDVEALSEGQLLQEARAFFSGRA